MKRRSQSEDATRQAQGLVSQTEHLGKSLPSVPIRDEHYGSMGRGKGRTGKGSRTAQQDWDDSMDSAMAQHKAQDPQRKPKPKAQAQGPRPKAQGPRRVTV